MDLRRDLMWVLCIWGLFVLPIVSGNAVFRVQRKMMGRSETTSLKEIWSHDARRHGRMLDSVDLQLGGNGLPTDAGLYFTKVQIGNPSKDYYVQVDTGSDILWVNCAGCDKCPKKSELGIKLSFYDPKGSSTANLVSCDEKECNMIYKGTLSGCQPDMLCQYEVTYGDGSQTAGYFVQDYVHYDKVSGNGGQTSAGNSSIVFGCGARQSGQLSSTGEALDGIIGFGQANSSVISQLAAAGKVKKTFAHCLDAVNGGGIFAIGEVAQPKIKSTAMVPNQAHYSVVMKSIEVAGDVMELSTDEASSGNGRAAIIDSGTTLAYLPDEVYKKVITKIMSRHTDIELHTVEDQFKCFKYSGEVDDGFPAVIFHFQNSLTMRVDPHDYFFPLRDRDNAWCIGWQSSGLQGKDGKDVPLLGDLVLSDKLVVYDLENKTIGWTDYNCSTSIKVKDGRSGAVYSLAAHDISLANSPISAPLLFFFVLLFAPLFIIHLH